MTINRIFIMASDKDGVKMMIEDASPRWTPLHAEDIDKVGSFRMCKLEEVLVRSEDGLEFVWHAQGKDAAEGLPAEPPSVWDEPMNTVDGKSR